MQAFTGSEFTNRWSKIPELRTSNGYVIAILYLSAIGNMEIAKEFLAGSHDLTQDLLHCRHDFFFVGQHGIL